MSLSLKYLCSTFAAISAGSTNSSDIIVSTLVTLKLEYTFTSAASYSEPRTIPSVIREAVGEDLVVISGGGVKDSSDFSA